MQSIEYALRGLDKAVAEERERAARAQKMLGDFQEQSGMPFEHEAGLKELLARQAELNAGSFRAPGRCCLSGRCFADAPQVFPIFFSCRWPSRS